MKDAGGAAEVDARHHISSFHGTHGLGHVRLATESITAAVMRDENGPGEIALTVTLGASRRARWRVRWWSPALDAV